MYQIFFKLLKGCLFIAALCCYTLVIAQDAQKVDSLKEVLSTKKGADQVEVLTELAVQYAGSDLEQSLQYIEQAKSIATDFGDSLWIVKASRMQGEVLRRSERIPEAIEVLNEVLPLAKRNRLRNDQKYILNSLALAYTIKADYDKALLFHFESLVLREADGDSKEISITLNNIGFVYFKLKNFGKAVDFYNRSLKLKLEAKDTYDLDRLLINIGLCYNQLSKFLEAETSINQGFAACKDHCNDQILIEGQFGLGLSNAGQRRFDTAKVYFQKSLALSRRIDNKRFQAENLRALAPVYIHQQKTDSAVSVLLECEQIAAGKGYNELLIETYKEFFRLYNQVADFEKASFYQNKYIALKDSVYSEKLIDNLAKIQSDFAERENIATIAQKEVVIKQQRDLSFAVLIIAILLGLLILVLQRSNRTIKRVNAQLSEAKEVIQEQNILLESKNKYLDREVESKTEDLERANQSLKQVNDELDNFIYKTSHDIRGPLASLKGMCNVALMDVKDPVALDYLRKLDTTAERLNTILTRLLIINQINNSKLSLSKVEFDLIVNDVLLLEKKKGLPQKLAINKFIEADVSIQSDKELIRIVLENLIDNAIKFYNDSERVESFVNIHVRSMDDGQVKVRVIDNGIGISEANPGKLFRMFFRASERSETGGIGLYIVKTATSKLGGKVGLLTTPEGHTEFYVVFPQYPPNPDETTEKPSI